MTSLLQNCIVTESKDYWYVIGLFADDANLKFSGKSTALLEQKMNEELLKVDDWMKANKLSLNYKKKNRIFDC